MPTFPDTACCGPFARGVPGSDNFGGCFGSCCENICPPECCETAEMVFECGSQSFSGFPEGCASTVTPLMPLSAQGVPNPIASQSLPTFSRKPITSRYDEFVFALAGTCSIPCTTVTVTLTASGGMCCLEIVGVFPSATVYAVGDGTVTANWTPTSGDECGDFTVSVNGTPMTFSGDSVSVSDGSTISVTVESGTSPTCCPCAQIETNDPCASPFWIIINGKRYLNKKALIEKANQIRRARVMRKIAMLRKSRSTAN